jgi:hypothetical protein
MNIRQDVEGMRTYLFILCSHSSGSTALWKLLQTSPNLSAMPVEGQFIDSVQPILRNSIWDEDKSTPWPLVKAEWEKNWDLEKPVLIEKSPPHLLHALEIQKHFSPAYFIVMVRNPYAYCEGTKRRGRAGLGYGQEASYQSIALGWIKECQYQMKNIRELDHVIHFTYEDLTRHTRGVSKKIIDFLPELDCLDFKAAFLIHSVHGWYERSITDLNIDQIARLSTEDIAEINSVLKKHPDIMEFFGYRYMKKALGRLNRMQLQQSNWYRAFIARNFQRAFRRFKKMVVND